MRTITTERGINTQSLIAVSSTRSSAIAKFLVSCNPIWNKSCLRLQNPFFSFVFKKKYFFYSVLPIEFEELTLSPCMIRFFRVTKPKLLKNCDKSLRKFGQDGRGAGWICEIEDKSRTLISRLKNKENVTQYTLFSSQKNNRVFGFLRWNLKRGKAKTLISLITLHIIYGLLIYSDLVYFIIYFFFCIFYHSTF